MNNRPTVWVLKEQLRNAAAFDYTPAYKYGDIRFITDFDLPLHAGSSLAKEWDKVVNSFMGDLDEERDYLILTGQPLAIFRLGQKLVAAGLSPRCLIWRREQNEYVVWQPTPIPRLATVG
jgi:hypothetical protein